jgi:hypothetical protein
VWSKLKKKLKSINWLLDTNESELRLTLVNGSQICLKSAEQGDNLRGESLGFCCIDEFCDLDLDEIWQQIIRPSLADKKGHALFIGTPKAANQAAKDLFDNHLTKPGWASFTYTTEQGGFVDPDEIAQARQDLAPKVFAQEYLASWETFAGVIFSEFGDHNIKPVNKPTDTEVIVAAIDFNTTPLCAVLGRQTRQGLEMFDEIILENSHTNELVDEIRNRYPRNPITAYPDPAGVQRKTSANGNTDIKILEMAGFQTRYHRQHPLVRDRINAGNSLFYKRDDGTTKFAIDPKCTKTIRSLKNWAFKEGTMIPDKDSGWDHACDALTYAVQYLYPITKPAPVTPQPQRWGHQLARA